MTLREIAVVFMCLFVIGAAEVVAGPMMEPMGIHFGVSSSEIAYLPGAYGLSYGVLALFAGPLSELSDRFGRMRPIISGLIGICGCCATLPHASTSRLL